MGTSIAHVRSRDGATSSRFRAGKPRANTRSRLDCAPLRAIPVSSCKHPTNEKPDGTAGEAPAPASRAGGVGTQPDRSSRPLPRDKDVFVPKDHEKDEKQDRNASRTTRQAGEARPAAVRVVDIVGWPSTAFYAGSMGPTIELDVRPTRPGSGGGRASFVWCSVAHFRRIAGCVQVSRTLSNASPPQTWGHQRTTRNRWGENARSRTRAARLPGSCH